MRAKFELKQPLTSHSGVAMLEMVLVAGLLCLFAFGGIELARMLRVSTALSNLARSAADEAKRDCAGLDDGAIPGCLDGVIGKITTLGNELVGSDFGPKSTVRIMAWRGYKSYPPLPGSSAPIERAVGSSPSRFQGVQDPDFVSILDNQRNVVVAELFYAYTPLTPLFNFMVNAVINEDKVIYEVVLI